MSPLIMTLISIEISGVKELIGLVCLSNLIELLELLKLTSGV